MTTILRVARLADRQVLKLADALVAELEGTIVSLQIGEVPVDRGDEVLNQVVVGRDSGSISAFDVSIGGRPAPLVSFRRGTGGTSQSIDTARHPSPYFDEIGIAATTTNGQYPKPEILLNTRRLISKHTSLPSDDQVVGQASEATELLKAHFAQLSEQLVEVNTASLKRREELEDEYANKRQHLDDELARHSEQLREEAERMATDHAVRLDELAVRAKQLDDRDHIHARRELRTHMTDAIATQLQGDIIPRKATWMSVAVFSLLIAGAVGLGLLSAWSLYEFGTLTYIASQETYAVDQGPTRAFALSQIQGGLHWLVLARGFLAGALSIGFLLYAISWLKGVYHDEVKTRRDLQRYATDLNRASWAIETIMEAKSSGDVAIPDAVIAGVTRNLFEIQTSGKSNSETSANALAELLRTSGRARFGPNGAEFELSSRGANRLADKIDE